MTLYESALATGFAVGLGLAVVPTVLYYIRRIL